MLHTLNVTKLKAVEAELESETVSAEDEHDMIATIENTLKFFELN